jgi:hypothetical protein
VALENQVAQVVWANQVVSANQVESVNQAARVVSENRVVPAQLRDRAARVVVDRAQCRPVAQAAAVVAPIVSVVISLPAAGAAARSVAEVPTSLGPVAAEAVPAWAAVDSAVAEEAVAVAAVVDVAVAVDVVVVVDAGDEQFRNGTKTYEIEIQHHDAIKNFFTRLCDCLVWLGEVCVAGRAGKNQAGCDGRFSVQTKTIQHTERGDR